MSKLCYLGLHDYRFFNHHELRGDIVAYATSGLRCERCGQVDDAYATAWINHDMVEIPLRPTPKARPATAIEVVLALALAAAVYVVALAVWPQPEPPIVEAARTTQPIYPMEIP